MNERWRDAFQSRWPVVMKEFYPSRRNDILKDSDQAGRDAVIPELMHDCFQADMNAGNLSRQIAFSHESRPDFHHEILPP